MGVTGGVALLRCLTLSQQGPLSLQCKISLSRLQEIEEC